MRYGQIVLNNTTPLRHAVNYMRRLKHLHERPILKSFNPPREEEPMSREAYRRLTARRIEQMDGLHL